MKIAIAQLNYTIGDVDGNASKIIDSIHKAKAQHADLVVFAEQAVSGTPAFDLLRKTTFLELCEDALVEIASCCDGIAAIVGLPILTAEGTISAAALIQDRKVLRYVGKKYITARREMGFLVPSKGYEYATIKGHKCAIIVGDDLSREHDFDQSVETIISVNARKYGKGTMTYRYEMMRNLAFVESKNLVLVNQVGGSTDIVYDGTSGALNSRGELVLIPDFRYQSGCGAGDGPFDLQRPHASGLRGRLLRTEGLLPQKRLPEGFDRTFGRYRLGGRSLHRRRCAGRGECPRAADALALLVP